MRKLGEICLVFALPLMLAGCAPGVYTDSGYYSNQSNQNYCWGGACPYPGYKPYRHYHHRHGYYSNQTNGRPSPGGGYYSGQTDNVDPGGSGYYSGKTSSNKKSASKYYDS